MLTISGTWYFGYGSNLDREDFEAWCREKKIEPRGLLKPVGPAFLPDRELAFTIESPSRKCGVLDIRPQRGALVEGVLFELGDEGLKALDRKEGVGPDGQPGLYRRIETVAQLLARHPAIGRRTSLRNVRVFIALPYPYLVFYKIDEERGEVTVLRVRHVARRENWREGR